MKDSPAHLYRRFRYHMGPMPDPEPADRWAAGHLAGAELELFGAMSVRDRVHSVAVARRVETALACSDASPEGWELRAALLHDAGKALTPLGVAGRVVASLADGTAVGAWFVRRSRRADARPGPLARMGSYLTYPELGASRLESIGSPREVSAWAREHHLSSEEWTVPAAAGRVLAEADGSA
ncbi:MAG: hypothetical protein R2754_04990 [Microthrixaceae bacterium]